jgi:hypothetical protein
MAIFTIKEHEYLSNKLNALQQAHLMRRLLPIVSSLAGLAKLSSGPDGKVSTEIAKDAFSPIANALSELSDESFNYIVNLCMGSVMRKDSERYVPAWNKHALLPQYEDIDLGVMLLIIGNVIQDNLSGFLPAGPSPLGELLAQKSPT